MVEKIKRNDYGDCVFSEDNLLDLLYQNPLFDISKLYIENTEQYSNALAELGLDLPPLQTLPKHTTSIKEFDRNNTEHWYMPAHYETIDVEKWLLDKCTSDIEQQRIKDEMILFREKGFTKVLQFLIFLVDKLRENNIVWGVGRGSSVSSFCLFIIGIHKINPIVYNLDYREFLR